METRTRYGLLLLIALLAPLPAWADLQKARDDRAVVAVTSNFNSVLVDVLANDGDLGPGLRILKVFKPAHGTVSIENGRIRYTPTPGFQGSDSFKYMVQAEDSQPGQATVNIEVGRGGVALRLKGQVVDSPIAGAIVKVSIGGFDFTAVADANGNYVLDIASLQGDAFVTLSATGTSESGAAVRFYSVVGEMVRLSNAAGSDGILVRDEFNQVNITNLSTAQYTLLADANGGVPVETDQQLLPLVQNIDLDELLKLAAIIKLVVDGGVALPPGTADALSLISDPAALQQFEAALAPGALELAIDEVSQDPAVTPIYRAGALPSGYAILPSSAPGTIRVGTGQGDLVVFQGSASSTSGAGNSFNTQGAHPLNWALDNGDLLVTPVSPTTESYNDVTGCTGNQYFQVQRTGMEVRVHRLQDGAGVDYLEIFNTDMMQYTDPDGSDACVPPANGPMTTSERLIAFEDFSGELPFAPGESFGRMVLTHQQVQPSPATTAYGAAIFDFDTHTVNIPGTNANFTASVVGGRLLVQLTDSTGVTNYEYRRYQSDGKKGEGLFSLVTFPNGSKLARYALASRIDGSAIFDVSNLPAEWLTGFNVSQFPGEVAIDSPPFFVSINDDAAHTGDYKTINPNASISISHPFTWNIESGRMLARSYRQFVPNFGQVPVNYCAVTGTNACWIRRIRTWQPIAREGNRIYVLEEVFDASLSNNVPSVPRLVAQRMNFYEAQ